MKNPILLSVYRYLKSLVSKFTEWGLIDDRRPIKVSELKLPPPFPTKDEFEKQLFAMLREPYKIVGGWEIGGHVEPVHDNRWWAAHIYATCTKSDFDEDHEFFRLTTKADALVTEKLGPYGSFPWPAKSPRGHKVEGKHHYSVWINVGDRTRDDFQHFFPESRYTAHSLQAA